ncbi:MAG: WD40 repeat domain-containing protein [Bdellovibrionales bacterium]
MSRSSAIHRQWNFNVPIVALAINRRGDWMAAAMGDGSLRLLPASDEAEQPKEMTLHNGVSLSLQPDADDHAFLSGGDDGKVFIIDPQLEAPTLLAEQKGKWIDHVAASAEGEFRAYSVGKKIHLFDAEGEERYVAETPSSPGGLAFSPNGKRLAASHYNGTSLYWTNSKDAAPVKLMWKGSHLGVIWHPDGKTVLTSMQESALHGWRLSDNKEMQMQGYAGKVHSMSFSAKGRYLATGGAEQAICWPFFGGGPWGKTPLTLGGNNNNRLVSRVAAHPKDEMVAAGYEDGMIILAPLDGRMDMLIHPPLLEKGTAVVGLAWNGAGDCLFAALENGYLLMFTIESVKRSVAHV